MTNAAAIPFAPQRFDAAERQRRVEELHAACRSALTLIDTSRTHRGLRQSWLAPWYRDNQPNRIEWLLLPGGSCPDEENLVELFAQTKGVPSAHERLDLLAAFNRAQAAAVALLEPLLPAALAFLPNFRLLLFPHSDALHIQLDDITLNSRIAPAVPWSLGLAPLLDAFERTGAAIARLGPGLFPPAEGIQFGSYAYGRAVRHQPHSNPRSIRRGALSVDAATCIRHIAAQEALRSRICEPEATAYPWSLYGFQHHFGSAADALQTTTEAAFLQLLATETAATPACGTPTWSTP